MKKTLLALAGIALLIVGCKKAEPITDGTLLLEFGAATQTVDVAGTLTPDDTYDWITMTQSGKQATFTVTTNVTGSIRTATYTMAGEANTAKFTVTQKSGTPAIFVKAGEDLQSGHRHGEQCREKAQEFAFVHYVVKTLFASKSKQKTGNCQNSSRFLEGFLY